MKDIEQPLRFNYSPASGKFMDKCPTVKTMKDFLNQFNDDMPLLFTWEGVTRGVDYHAFEPENVNDGKESKSTVALIISVE